MLKSEIAFLVDNFEYTNTDINKLENLLEFFDDYIFFKKSLYAVKNDKYFTLKLYLNYSNGNFRIILKNDTDDEMSILYHNLFEILTSGVNTLKKYLFNILKYLDLINR